MSDDIILGWHFLSPAGTAYNGYRPPAVGVWEPPIDNPKPCVRGYHGSPTILKALQYATGPILGRCEYRGVVWHGDRDKWAARERRCIARVDASSWLRFAAAHIAERAIVRAGVTDERCHEAIRVARRFALGVATAEELRAAPRAAPRAVAHAAASDAAHAAVRAAAWAAVRAAAWVSAYDAAHAAASYYAAYAAANASAYAAAYAAASAASAASAAAAYAAAAADAAAAAAAAYANAAAHAAHAAAYYAAAAAAAAAHAAAYYAAHAAAHANAAAYANAAAWADEEQWLEEAALDLDCAPLFSVHPTR